MASMILKLTKLAGWSIGIYWALIALFVIFDPSLPPSIFIAPWGLDWAAVVIFVASISIILYLIRDLNKRRHVKQTTTIKMLLLAFFAFLLALAMS
nr:hypothetical protein [Candidatus Sigynarchaeota archaeon]